MDSFSKFNEKKLPPIEKFYSALYGSGISEREYEHAKLYGKHSSVRTLVTTVFENFRETCLNHYNLDPCHDYAYPGLSWDALLKTSKIELEPLSDIDMFQVIEKGMTNGISCITHRYAKANNKYLHDHNPKESSSHIIYLDANNL